MRAKLTLCASAIAIVVAGYAGFAQVANEVPEGVELTGNWVSRNFTEFNTNLHRAYDFLGMRLNDAAHAWALSHSEEQASEPERECAFYSSTYFPFGFAPLPMWKETELHNWFNRRVGRRRLARCRADGDLDGRTAASVGLCASQ